MNITRTINGMEYTFSLTPEEIAGAKKAHDLSETKGLVNIALELGFINEEQRAEMIEDEETLLNINDYILDKALEDAGELEMEAVRLHANN